MLNLDIRFLSKFRADIRGLIFDLDGVTYDSARDTSTTTQHLFQAARYYGIPITKGVFDRYKAACPFVDLLASVKKVFEITDDALVERVFEEWFRIDQENPPPLFKETRQVLELLNSLDDGEANYQLGSDVGYYTLGILSGRPQARLEPALLHSDIKKYFHHDLIFGSDMYQGNKDQGHAFDGILERYVLEGIKPEQCIYCGDTPPDAVGALLHGMHPVCFRSGMFNDKDFLQVGVPAENIIDGIWELPAWLGL